MTMDLQAKIDHLSRPESYPEETPVVEMVTTHMSCVFLTACHAYKLKKPVRYSFLDFSTIEARHRDCLEEVRLNRRLAPDVYLAVEPLAADPGGALQVGGRGRPLDWLVKMRRLPRALMLDQRIRDGDVPERLVEAFTRALVAFYERTPVEPLGPDAYRQRLAEDIQGHARELSDPRYGISLDAVQAIVAVCTAVLHSDRRLFEARVTAGRIVEGHGDLRPEHVWVGPPPLFIDCLEFNRRFRVVDPADELAYLALECEYAGAPQVGELILDSYRNATGDHPPARLVHFHKACRALLRAKLSIWHLQDHHGEATEKWRRRTAQYLALAERYAARL
ncbi:MAG TPA: hypothetical protein VKA76_05345 [Gammaproteobacteria bacterium]|nr:hypothetical protein [Gammaproteobacteria bacterium]